MPTILLERLPFPSLRSYISLSVLALAMACFYAHQTVHTKMNFDLMANTNSNETPELAEKKGIELGLPPELANVTLPYDNDEHFLNMVHVMTVETWCIWTLVNTCFCLLILLGKLIQNFVFGELRVSEKQHLKDKFWNFVFYKFIFIFGVMNVQSMNDVVLWIAWFSLLGFLHLLTQLAKDRFEFLSFSPATPQWAHVKLLGLLMVILSLCLLLLLGCVWVGFNFSFTIFAFLAAEGMLLLLKCSYVVVRYVIQLWDLSQEGVWEARAVYVYYAELTFELLALVVDFGHHMHMLLHGNIFLSMASLVICMQLRYLFYEFQRRIRRHKNYLRVVKDMEAKFPMATQEDLEHNADDCAICWEKMESARKLPCSHLFHNSCLRSWLEQDTSCPTCRTSLGGSPTGPHHHPGPEDLQAPGPNPLLAEAMAPPQPNQGTTNHFFHFDGSRYVSWLPSFSVEVTHTNLLPGQQAHATQTSQLDNMAREVQVVFPNIPLSVIMDDLRLTRSIDLTINNILEGRINIPSVPSLPNGSQQQWNDGQNESNNSSSLEMFDPPPYTPPTTSTNEATYTTTSTDQEPLQHFQLTQLGSEGARAASSPSTSTLDDPGPSSSSGGGATALGGRFSKSASERMAMLQQRKLSMVEQARRRYQNRQEETISSSPSTSSFSASTSSTPSTSSPSLTHPLRREDSSLLLPPPPHSDSEAVQRRAVLLEATQRRLGPSTNGQ